MFCHRLPRHVELPAEGIEGLAVVLMKLVKQVPPARISQGFEDIVHGSRLCNQMVACQSGNCLVTRRVRASLLGSGSAPTTCDSPAPRGLPLQIKRASSEIDDPVMGP